MLVFLKQNHALLQNSLLHKPVIGEQMKKIMYFLLLIPCLSLADPGLGFDECSKKAITTIEIRQCLAQELSYYDKKLNASYNELISKLAKHQQDSLKKAQRAWLAYRNAECDFAAFSEQPGTIAPVIITTCFINMTKNRVNELNTYLLNETDK